VIANNQFPRHLSFK